jgi:hypothetical protein
VAAAAVGSSVTKPAVRGVAPGAQLWAYDWQLATAEMESDAAALDLAFAPFGPKLGFSFDPLCPDHMTFWGAPGELEDPAYGRYTAEASDVDRLCARTDLLVVWPSGNERLDRGGVLGEPHYHVGERPCQGPFTDPHLQEATLQYGTIGGNAVAKNVLTIGATRSVAFADLTAQRIVALDSSSFGPTADGRIKPELAAGGALEYSAAAALDDAFSQQEGTSGAAAVAAGVTALVQEAYVKTHGGASATGAELKALLVQTAREAGAAPGPDYALGYGLLDAFAAAQLVALDAQEEPRSFVGSLAPGETIELAMAQPSAAADALRVTLAWTDPPGPPGDGSQRALVNDLDLTLVGPDGSVFFPWTLDPLDPLAPAARTHKNDRDNLEVIDVETPHQAGVFHVRVRAPDKLARDQRQRFALVSSVPLSARAGALLQVARHIELDRDAGPRLRATLKVEARDGSSTPIRARSLAPWLALQEQASTPAQLELEVDTALLPDEDPVLARVELETADGLDRRLVGVVVQNRCVPACALQPCGGCGPGTSCEQAMCRPWLATCPAADLGRALGIALAEGELSQRDDVLSASCADRASVSIAFGWTASATGRYVFSTRGSDSDTLLLLRRNACGGDELACNDDSLSTDSTLSAALEEGDQLVIGIGSLAAGRGAFVLSAARARCAAVDLGSRLGMSLVRGTTYGGVDDLAAPCGGQGAKDVSFAWTAPVSSLYRFLLQADYPALLHLRSQDCEGAVLGCSAAPELAPIELAVEAGQQLVVVVDGVGDSSGKFSLGITDSSASCAGACESKGARCACDAACLAFGDCCEDACSSCGRCQCVPDCANRECGSDGCGDSCGTCEPGLRCNDRGRCIEDPCAGVECDTCQRCVEGRCETLPEGSRCEDGDLCTILDACRDGVCQGLAKPCEDGFRCTENSCAQATGACEARAIANCCETCPDDRAGRH